MIAWTVGTVLMVINVAMASDLQPERLRLRVGLVCLYLVLFGGAMVGRSYAVLLMGGV